MLRMRAYVKPRGLKPREAQLHAEWLAGVVGPVLVLCAGANEREHPTPPHPNPTPVLLDVC